MLLHSSDHDTLNFTAVETRTTNALESHLKHYVAVYDPETRDLTVTEAKNVAARTQIRQYETPNENEEAYSTRLRLTEAFGTKKSKKAVQAMAENRLSARGTENDPLSQAIQASVALDHTDAIATDSALSNKPLPRANLNTEDIREVYALSELVFPSGTTTLDSMSIAYWADSASKNRPIKLNSHFISNRIGPLFQVQKATETSETQTHERIIQQIQLLRYLDLLLQIHRFLAAQRKRFRIPPPAMWPEKTIESSFDISTVKGILSRLFPDKSTSASSMTLLRTTILAITLHIPPAGRTPDYQTLIAEPTDIAKDLGIERDEITRLYRELGCKNGPLNDTEMSIFGLSKLKGALDANGEPVNFKKVKFAKLRFPVEFPKVSQGRREKRR